MHMNTNMGTTIYWHKNQLIVRLKAQVRRSTLGTANPVDFVAGKVKDAFDKLNNQAILGKSLDVHPIDEQPLEFCPPISSIASAENVDVGLFYRIDPTNMGSMQGDGGAAGMGDDDRTLAVIQQLDHGKVLQKALQNEEGLSTDPDSVHVIPHWLKACTPDTVQGCPISPPIPVEEPSASVQRKLQFQGLPDPLKNATGKGVTVLVLDTLPTQDQIKTAASQAGDSNLLLKAMAEGMRWEEPFTAVPPAINFRYQKLPDVVEGTPPERVGTGKDIYGRHVGFNLTDHGLFIAGIIRDLAPEAKIECIRVLNDDGVGDVARLGSALKHIRDRMEPGRDLHNKPVVINLSMVVLPPDDDMPIPDEKMLRTEILMHSRDLLSSLIRCVADEGAIFVAAAGNDSDPRMDVSEIRFGPRYPAALADDEPYSITRMIPVGAVNLNKQAARYSNYPGRKGIATYGGDIPKPDPWLPSAMWHVPANVDRTNLDALCGVYSATECPALSKNDGQQTYAVPTSSAWAYWSGTSFATPIISALAARILQGQDLKGVDVRQAIIAAAGKQTVSWTGVGDKREDIPGSMIIAEQK
jgi:subtilisin family serine protease